MLYYSVINHIARIKHDLTTLECCLLDSYAKLSNKPGYEYCKQSKTKIGEFIGCTRRHVITTVQKMVGKGFLEENDKGYIRTTQLYHDEFELSMGTEFTEVGTNFTPGVNKLHTNRELSSHNNNNNIKENKRTNKKKTLTLDEATKIADQLIYSKDLFDKYNEWLTYKMGRGEMYANEQTLSTNIKQWLKMSTNPVVLADVIDNSIGNEYKGLYPPKNTPQTPLGDPHLKKPHMKGYFASEEEAYDWYLAEDRREEMFTLFQDKGGQEYVMTDIKPRRTKRNMKRRFGENFGN